MKDYVNQMFYELSCCVDTVAAEHYNADSLVHFGHSCLSLVDKLPVLWVFNKLPLDLEFVKSKIDEINKQIEKVIILYDVSYHYLYGSSNSFF